MRAFRHTMLLTLARIPNLLPQPWRRRVLSSRWVAVARKAFISLARQETTAVVGLTHPLNGYRMRINLQMQKAYMYGTYEPAVVKFIVDTVKDGWVAFDVGANIGYTTLLIGNNSPGGRVYAFEPLPQNFACLHENVLLNRMVNVQCEQMALGDVAEKRHFHYRTEALTAGGSILADTPVGIDESISDIEVDVITGDEYVAKNGIGRLDMLKIDVEGAEGLVLKGMRGALRQLQPLILVELHDFEGSTAHLVRPLLDSLGYSCSMLDESHLVATPIH